MFSRRPATEVATGKQNGCTAVVGRVEWECLIYPGACVAIVEIALSGK